MIIQILICLMQTDLCSRRLRKRGGRADMIKVGMRMKNRPHTQSRTIHHGHDSIDVITRIDDHRFSSLLAPDNVAIALKRTNR